MSKQPPPAPTASAVGPCPTVIKIVGRPGTGSLPSTIAPPDHPQGGGCLDILTLLYPFSPLSPSLWETARYRLKYCLKGPLNPKQATNQPTFNFDYSRARAYCAYSRCGWGLFGHFYSHLSFLLSPSLWETYSFIAFSARYSLFVLSAVKPILLTGAVGWCDGPW